MSVEKTAEVDAADENSSGEIEHEKSLIDKDVAEKWEREQVLMKEKLITINCEDWQRKIEDNKSTYESGDEIEGLEYIGGVDISFIKGDDVNACASLIVLNYPELEVVYEDLQMIKLTEPYVPGFLAFRESNFLVDQVKTLQETSPELMPQVIMYDGNGLLHPREFGVACHLGVLLDIPCIGVAKKLFQVDGLEKNAEHLDKIKQLEKGGDTFPLIGETGKVLGMALRSCDRSTNPIYVSIGHRISLETAVWLVVQCCNHRIPEPVRQADIRSREYLRVNFKPNNEVDSPTADDNKQ